jgi:hypothetical protein
MLGVDSKFDLIRKTRTYAADMIIENIVKDKNMRPLYEEVVQSLKTDYKIDINDITESLDTLIKNKVVAIRSRANKICLVDPEIAPFLYVNLRKARHVSKEYKECQKSDPQLPLFCNIE